MNKPSEIAALDAVKTYLLLQNRPYSANEVFENLHKEHGKTDSLLVCNEEELNELDLLIKQKTAELKEFQQSIRTLESELKLASNSLTNEEMSAKIKLLESENEDYREKLESLKELAKNISLEEKEKINKSHENNVKEWRSRKRIASDILNTILESWPKKKKDLYDEIGVETDEEHKVICP